MSTVGQASEQEGQDIPVGMSISPTSDDKVIFRFSWTHMPLSPSSSPWDSIFVPNCISTGTPRSYLHPHSNWSDASGRHVNSRRRDRCAILKVTSKVDRDKRVVTRCLTAIPGISDLNVQFVWTQFGSREGGEGEQDTGTECPAEHPLAKDGTEKKCRAGGRHLMSTYVFGSEWLGEFLGMHDANRGEERHWCATNLFGTVFTRRKPAFATI